ncbi:MerR family DNA-binding protein [Alloactinosynnema sp. L-07]|uniref:MerR family DNA-binding protein n=1 Tax=Alloactinosynnema sp. L-07 TaxID=1653480 RepID=UPI0009EF2BFA
MRLRANTGEASPELLTRLREHRDGIDRRIADLRSTRDRLDTVITSATNAWETGRPCRPR